MTADERVGTISLFAGDYAPVNSALCIGGLYEISKYAALYSVIGTAFGGDGRTTAGIPDLRGRFALGAGQGPTLTSRKIGVPGGAEGGAITVTTDQLPSHTHAAAFTANSLNASVTTTPDLSTLEIEVTLKCNSASFSGVPPVNAYPATNPAVDCWAAGVNGSMGGDMLTQGAITDLTLLSEFGPGPLPVTVQSTGGGQSIPIDYMPPFTALTYVMAMIGNYPPRP